eukprot:TRINITY_DN7906_c0_g1_i2.p3 TRINITY_DN7906_c0_g1~~TRINITY_DN7906_c0_g1_i2.p3  ORF type:complete len:172 (-),score=50.59 TRINITY_DN7906_c0_g1_i2:162-677(-)
MSVRKEAAWALSNVAAGTEGQIQIIINEGISDKLVSLALQDAFDVRRECVWCLTNAASNANAEQLKHLIDAGAVEAVCSLLVCNDARTIAISLEGLENMLKRSRTLISAEFGDSVALRVEKCKGLNALEALESHSNTLIYKKVVGIIEQFFEVEDEPDIIEVPKSLSIFDF